MPKGNLNKPCKRSHEPESQAARRKRLAQRRERQLARVGGYVVENPEQRRTRIAGERAMRRAGLANEVFDSAHDPRRLKVGETYDRKGKR